MFKGHKNKNSKTNQALTIKDLSISEDFDININLYKMNISSNFMRNIVSIYNRIHLLPQKVLLFNT